MTDLHPHIREATGFLKRQLLEGAYSLRCVNQQGEKKYSDGKGHLFSLFFMTRALQGALNEIERTIIITRIISEAMEEEWGYSPRGYYKEESYNPFFTDADDTAFALRICRLLGVYRSPQVLLRYVADWEKQGKAFVTFKNNQRECSIASSPTFENNFHLHAEVNANVFSMLHDSEYDNFINMQFIATAQHADGAWRGYFYPGAYYATWQFMRLLHRMRQTQSAEFKKGISFLLHSQEDDGSWMGNSYHTGLALAALTLDDAADEQKQRAVRYLLQQQRDDGSWEYNSVIWQFPDRGGEMWLASDNHRVVTTAICAEALQRIA